MTYEFRIHENKDTTLTRSRPLKWLLDNNDAAVDRLGLYESTVFSYPTTPVRGSNHVLSDPILLFVSLSFFPSLIILTLYFSSILAGRSTKRTFYRGAFVVSFSGLAISAAFALATPLLPISIPVINVGDLGMAFAVIAWVLLLRYYCGTGWLETLPPAFIAVIIHVVIIAIASGFSILLLEAQP